MSDQVLIAIIGILLALINGTVGVFIAKLNTKVNSVQDQVVNNHKRPDGSVINLREEQDERHTENSDKLNQIIKEQERTRGTLTRVWQKLDKHTDEIHDLEITQITGEKK